jgi:hypothetical protein
LSAQHEAAGFVTFEEIRRLEAFAADTLIGIKAPTGTELNVPDPDEDMQPGQRRYQMFLSSASGPIDLLLISDVDTPQEQPQSENASMEVKPKDEVVEGTRLNSPRRTDLEIYWSALDGHETVGLSAIYGIENSQ